MTQHALAVLLAASFTFGCAAIHVWRERVSDLTSSLAAALLCLTILAGSVAVVRTSGDDRGGSQFVPRALR